MIYSSPSRIIFIFVEIVVNNLVKDLFPMLNNIFQSIYNLDHHVHNVVIGLVGQRKRLNVKGMNGTLSSHCYNH